MLTNPLQLLCAAAYSCTVAKYSVPLREATRPLRAEAEVETQPRARERSHSGAESSERWSGERRSSGASVSASALSSDNAP